MDSIGRGDGREKIGRTEEPPVGVSRATLMAVFVTQKLRYVTTFGNANMYPLHSELLVIGIPRISAGLKLYN